MCFHEIFLMGIRYENILLYNLELLLSKDYIRTYTSHITEPYLLTRLLTDEEMQSFDAVFVSGGNCSVLCREMARTGFDIVLKRAINNGLTYVGISAGSMYAAGNLTESLHIIDNPVVPHWTEAQSAVTPYSKDAIKLTDGQAVYIEGQNICLL